MIVCTHVHSCMSAYMQLIYTHIHSYASCMYMCQNVCMVACVRFDVCAQYHHPPIPPSLLPHVISYSFVRPWSGHAFRTFRTFLASHSVPHGGQSPHSRSICTSCQLEESCHPTHPHHSTLHSLKKQTWISAFLPFCQYAFLPFCLSAFPRFPLF